MVLIGRGTHRPGSRNQTGLCQPKFWSDRHAGQVSVHADALDLARRVMDEGSFSRPTELNIPQ